ncbi:MAG: CesT family type III secretion system chaperone [Methylocystis sp.]|uniref:CesT family type III secretion system chaperone n=1 Tax=Methylocystis sp. TaxID=1911079 RepID=UPI003DA5D1D3
MSDEAPNDHDGAKDALGRLSKELGLELADGALFIPFDEFFECILSPSAGGRISMEIALIMVEGDRGGNISRQALKLNADPSVTADGSISLDPTGSVLTLKAFTAADPRNPDALGNAVAQFIEAARGLIETLTGEGGDAQPSPPETPFDPRSFVIRG